MLVNEKDVRKLPFNQPAGNVKDKIKAKTAYLKQSASELEHSKEMLQTNI